MLKTGNVYLAPLPGNPEAEEGVLSCLLYNPRSVVKVIDTLAADDFQNDDYGTIYRAIVALYHHGKACTLPNVRAELKRMERFDGIGDTPLLDNLESSLATLQSITDYADTMKDASTMRKLIAHAEETYDDACHQREGTLERAMERLSAIMLGADNKPVSPLAEAVDRYMTRYNERRMDFALGKLPGISTGFVGLDRLLNRMQPSRLYTLASRTGIGKTSLALNIAFNIIKEAHHVLFFSLEMDEVELVQRLFSMETAIDQAYLDNGDTNDAQDREVTRAAAKLKGLDLKLDDHTYLLSSIMTKAKQVHSVKKLGLIVLDYMNLTEMQVGGRGRHESRAEEVGKMSKGLKRLSRDLKVPVLALAQLNRESEKSLLPQLAQLGESDNIGRDSDVVMLIHCDESEIEKRNKSQPYRLNIIVPKQRNGRIGQVELMFRPRLVKFDDPAPETYDDSQQ